jgi:hypothetical protein
MVQDTTRIILNPVPLLHVIIPAVIADLVEQPAVGAIIRKSS